MEAKELNTEIIEIGLASMGLQSATCTSTFPNLHISQNAKLRSSINNLLLMKNQIIIKKNEKEDTPKCLLFFYISKVNIFVFQIFFIGKSAIKKHITS